MLCSVFCDLGSSYPWLSFHHFPPQVSAAPIVVATPPSTVFTTSFPGENKWLFAYFGEKGLAEELRLSSYPIQSLGAGIGIVGLRVFGVLGQDPGALHCCPQ